VLPNISCNIIYLVKGWKVPSISYKYSLNSMKFIIKLWQILWTCLLLIAFNEQYSVMATHPNGPSNTFFGQFFVSRVITCRKSFGFLTRLPSS
jgi:hypothetical protein